ncbi:MAG TPA: IS1595 family transposase [Candidatus Limnocylindrales bacterium]|nr:IS1595 family transposase [Candidatus Limnocylindrales bacterium]
MPPVDRNNPKRANSSDSQLSLMEFMRDFPDDAACLEHLWRSRYSPDGTHADCPKCEREGVVFKRYATKQGRQSWTCTACGHHVHPTAGTIFHKSSTSLHLWYYAMYLMTSTRCGISAKQLEREIGVSYKTAWRMLNRIRTELMKQDDEPLQGDVEVDETFGGGRVRAGDSRRGLTWVKKSRRPTIWAAVERGGRVKAHVVKSRGTLDVEGPIFKHVLPSSMIFTDEWGGYSHRVGSRYIAHHRIRHEDRVYVSGNVHTQTVEGFFGNMKNGIRGTYHSVSSKWLPSYLNEYAFRYNERSNSERAMFDTLLAKAAE